MPPLQCNLQGRPHSKRRSTSSTRGGLCPGTTYQAAVDLIPRLDKYLRLKLYRLTLKAHLLYNLRTKKCAKQWANSRCLHWWVRHFDPYVSELCISCTSWQDFSSLWRLDALYTNSNLCGVNSNCRLCHCTLCTDDGIKLIY